MSYWQQAFSGVGSGSSLNYWRNYFDEPGMDEKQMKMYLSQIQNRQELENNEQERQKRQGVFETTTKVTELFQVNTVTQPEQGVPTIKIKEQVEIKIPGDLESEDVWYEVTMWDEPKQEKLEKNKIGYIKYKVGSKKTPAELLEDEFERQCAPNTYVDQDGNVWERKTKELVV